MLPRLPRGPRLTPQEEAVRRAHRLEDATLAIAALRGPVPREAALQHWMAMAELTATSLEVRKLSAECT